MNKPNILVSNDDGIDAEGLYQLVLELKKFANVYVAAPHRQQSAVGHSITLYYPLRAFEFSKNGEFFGMAVEGTPADAVKLGALFLFKDIKFDLVVSGINHGSNTAINIIYSGTVSAATEGNTIGIPAIAISSASFEKVNFKEQAEIASGIVRQLFEKNNYKLDPKLLLNINIPVVPKNEIKGIKITKQGKSYWEDSFEVRADPSGRDYYWLTGKMVVLDESDEFDVVAVKHNYVSITTLHYDLTSYNQITELENLNLKL